MGNTRLRQELISCLAATISAATALFHMFGGVRRSRNPGDIIRKLKGGIRGVVEIMLLGQNVNSYGKNLEEPMTFAQLLTEIEKNPGT